MSSSQIKNINNWTCTYCQGSGYSLNYQDAKIKNKLPMLCDVCCGTGNFLTASQVLCTPHPLLPSHIKITNSLSSSRVM